MLLLLAAAYFVPQSTAMLNGQTVQQLALDGQDNAWILASTSSAARLTKFNPAGRVPLSTDLRGINGTSTAVDPQGAAYVAGVNSGDGIAFVAKLNSADGSSVYRATLGAVVPAAVPVDSSGSAYVTGTPNAVGALNGLVATPGAYQTARKGAHIFVLKLSPTADQVVYSTLLGGSKTNYVCVLPAAYFAPIPTGLSLTDVGSGCLEGYLPDTNAVVPADRRSVRRSGSSRRVGFTSWGENGKRRPGVRVCVPQFSRFYVASQAIGDQSAILVFESVQ